MTWRQNYVKQQCFIHSFLWLKQKPNQTKVWGTQKLSWTKWKWWHDVTMLKSPLSIPAGPGHVSMPPAQIQRRNRRQEELDRWRAWEKSVFCQGWKCCHLLSLSVLASCLSAHSESQPVHMSGLFSSLCLWASARPQKRVNATVELTGPSLPCHYTLTGRNFNELVGLFGWLQEKECNCMVLTRKLLVREWKSEEKKRWGGE